MKIRKTRSAMTHRLTLLFGLLTLIGLGSLRTVPVQNSQAKASEVVTTPQAERCFSCPPTDTAGRGLQLFSTGGRLKVTIMEAESAFVSKIYVRPGPTGKPRQFLGTNRDVGNMICLDPSVFPAGTEYVFEIEVGDGPTPTVFQTGPKERNPDNLVHDIISCQLERPVIGFEDFLGGGDSDFNDVRIEISCCEDKCDLFNFLSPDYFLQNTSRLPGGAVFIGGVNYNNPVGTNRADTIRFALEGGGAAGNPLQQLNREYVAAQLSLGLVGGEGSPSSYNALWSPLRCLGPIGPVTLGNGFILNSNAMLKDLFTQSRLAILENRTADYQVLALAFADLHCNNPFPMSAGGVCLPPVAYPDLLPLQTKAGYCDRNAAGDQLTVTVYNGTSAPAACTVVRVEFFTSPPMVLEKELTAVPAFGTTPATFDVPPGCFGPDCSFRITVNARSCSGQPSVIETKRANNVVTGRCMG